jgi:hypothetical protein
MTDHFADCDLLYDWLREDPDDADVRKGYLIALQMCADERPEGWYPKPPPPRDPTKVEGLELEYESVPMWFAGGLLLFVVLTLGILGVDMYLADINLFG